MKISNNSNSGTVHHAQDDWQNFTVRQRNCILTDSFVEEWAFQAHWMRWLIDLIKGILGVLWFGIAFSRRPIFNLKRIQNASTGAILRFVCQKMTKSPVAKVCFRPTNMWLERKSLFDKSPLRQISVSAESNYSTITKMYRDSRIVCIQSVVCPHFGDSVADFMLVIIAKIKKSCARFVCLFAVAMLIWRALALDSAVHGANIFQSAKAHRPIKNCIYNATTSSKANARECR